jgi:histone-lysine N-methyltransferase SETD2
MDCVHRFNAQEECDQDCPSGKLCWNNSIRKKKWKKNEVFEAGKKGYGLRMLESVRGDEFVMEYEGSVVTTGELSRHGNEYLMALDSETYIDASNKQYQGRYINHSCDPNCQILVWVVSGKRRAGIFSLKEIEAGEEITIDYRWSGNRKTKCYCKKANCRGYIEMITARGKK